MVIIKNFFHIFRKKGTAITLEMLGAKEKNEMLQSEFLRELKKKKNDLNAYFRVKKVLMKYKIISFKLNQNAQKVIFLTELGRTICNSISDIDSKLSD